MWLRVWLVWAIGVQPNAEGLFEAYAFLRMFPSATWLGHKGARNTHIVSISWAFSVHLWVCWAHYICGFSRVSSSPIDRRTTLTTNRLVLLGWWLYPDCLNELSLPFTFWRREISTTGLRLTKRVKEFEKKAFSRKTVILPDSKMYAFQGSKVEFLNFSP